MRGRLESMVIRCPVCKTDKLILRLHPNEDVYLAHCSRCNCTYILEGGELIYDARRIPL